ncbi:phosphotransferase [Leifsonia sp. NPDC056665]|uniref:phosphotransferase n=1 Tax=Leifsonia sp. NPDC056665 TaxID=3345901 RepID=UPI0036CF0FB5
MNRCEQPWDSSAPEEPLLGGDVTVGVVRSGDTVRRPRSASSERVRALLTHLERVGFAGAPRFLGVDDRDRDVITFMEGEVAGRPAPEWVASDDRAMSVARLLRSYHDAVASFGVPAVFDDAAPTPPEGAPEPVPMPLELIGHRDVTLENVVFRDGVASALIDFDLARPSSRVEDVCNMLQWWAPWQPVGDRAEVLKGVDAFARAAKMLDAYGLDAGLRPRLVPVARNAAERTWHTMKLRAERDGGGWRRMWEEGVGDAIRRRQSWLQENEEALVRAVM